MKINFINMKGIWLKHKIKKAYKEIFKDLKINDENITINLGYVNESAMQKLNHEKRGIDKVTDVLSFPLIDFELGVWLTPEIIEAEKHPQTGMVEIGDVIICENIARMQATRYGHSFLREVSFLSVHGLLHVLGFDHQTKEDEEKMTALCEKVLEKIGVTR
ncbi:MAG: rRNA maturation RNase YbeY [Christensenellales bacterium]|jgi:probable rRNA maturation factor